MSATLLVVDDDAMNRDALSRRIASAGYTVLVAESGSQAIEMVRTERVDLVLLDVMMPEMSGVETLRRLRQQRTLADLPVIMVTAKTGSDDVVEALEGGAQGVAARRWSKRGRSAGTTTSQSRLIFPSPWRAFGRS